MILLLVEIFRNVLCFNFTCNFTVSGAVNNSKNVVFLGDSMIHKPTRWHGLFHKIQDLLITSTVYNNVTKVNLIDEGQTAATIDKIFKRLSQVFQSHCPIAAVILFWDSDVSDVKEYGLSSEEIEKIRFQYLETLNSTISIILQTGASLAISGPGTLGEGKKYFLPKKWKYKHGMLEDYHKITQNIATQFGIPYLDMRKSFFNDEGRYFIYSAFDTIDGEHPNQRGTLLQASIFAAQINAWLLNASSALYLNTTQYNYPTDRLINHLII